MREIDLKIDINKAYNRIDRKILRFILLKLGFA